MGASIPDIKKLWGLAAGRCSYPGCDTPCIDSGNDDRIIIGEMAHVISKRTGGGYNYNNLILLCPTHHTEIDKSPDGTFTEDDILRWKRNHETNVAEALTSPTFTKINEISKYIKKLLIENKNVWETCGPESAEAVANPLSNLAQLWILRKLETIIPNNRRIINAIRKNKKIFRDESYEISCKFIEHAEGFERNCYNRSEGISSFPQRFDEMVTFYANL